MFVCFCSFRWGSEFCREKWEIYHRSYTNVADPERSTPLEYIRSYILSFCRCDSPSFCYREDPRLRVALHPWDSCRELSSLHVEIVEVKGGKSENLAETLPQLLILPLLRALQLNKLRIYNLQLLNFQMCFQAATVVRNYDRYSLQSYRVLAVSVGAEVCKN